MTAPQFGRSDNRASPDRGAPTSDWVEELFIDYGADPVHAGPPAATEESARFRLTQGGIKWFSDGAVKYEITGTEDVAGGNTAVEDAVSTINGFVTTRNITRDDDAPTDNPCGGVSQVVWATIDGSGGILATASVCRNNATKEIGGFVVTIDIGETWSVSGAEEAFDVRNVLTHEFGHVAGLGHVNAPKDGCLTMYKLAGRGEIQKRTLGLGDKRGMDALYSTGDVSAGTCAT